MFWASTIALLAILGGALGNTIQTQGDRGLGSGGEAIDRRSLGRAQADIWVPVDMLEARSVEQRRHLMIDRIRREVAARHSTIDPVAVERVLAAMAGIDREAFVPRERRRQAYLPSSIDIGSGQTLSDAYLVTVMTVAARVGPGDRVLDVGTGSGYQAALFARMGASVTSIEILPELAATASRRLKQLGFGDVTVIRGDGAAGVPGAARFDAIVVAAGAPTFPAALVAQLAQSGRLVMPIGPTQAEERLLVATRTQTGALDVCSLGLAAAVPLTGPAARLPGRAVAVDPPACFGRPVT